MRSDWLNEWDRLTDVGKIHFLATFPRFPNPSLAVQFTDLILREHLPFRLIRLIHHLLGDIGSVKDICPILSTMPPPYFPRNVSIHAIDRIAHREGERISDDLFAYLFNDELPISFRIKTAFALGSVASEHMLADFIALFQNKKTDESLKAALLHTIAQTRNRYLETDQKRKEIKLLQSVLKQYQKNLPLACEAALALSEIEDIRIILDLGKHLIAHAKQNKHFYFRGRLLKAMENIHHEALTRPLIRFYRMPHLFPEERAQALYILARSGNQNKVYSMLLNALSKERDLSSLLKAIEVFVGTQPFRGEEETLCYTQPELWPDLSAKQRKGLIKALFKLERCLLKSTAHAKDQPLSDPFVQRVQTLQSVLKNT